MSDKSKSLYQKYRVEKLSNPAKDVDCIVLEFDDPIARVGIAAWMHEMRHQGFIDCATDTFKKLAHYEMITSEELAKGKV